ncbi:MAG: HDIG domain-containing protein [Planctomycetes bacterium]|jgi:putative nucleotidyltransferase with HDIG domain|nr:HDIG domain-containing protein [Planctomycetota bacterium]
MTRDDAWRILTEHTLGESLRKHALTVEAVMRAFARKLGADEEAWGIAGLLHDFDYEIHPTSPDHPLKGSEILAARGVPEEIRLAILGHVDVGVARESLMAKVLYAVDELSGFVTAVALVRPSKSIHEVEPRSVLKKLKDKAFAAKVSREDIRRGMEELGVDPAAHIAEVIAALKPVAPALGLAGPGREE